MLASPIAVTVSADGDLYIADHRNSRIRVVDAATGIITTVAGMGEQGFSGDGGPAVQAAISLPRDVALDSDGSLYIADGANNRIRKVDSNGTITTVVGTGRTEFSDDGDPAHKASLSMPYSIALDGCRETCTSSIPATTASAESTHRRASSPRLPETDHTASPATEAPPQTPP